MTFIKRIICFVLFSVAICDVTLAQFMIPLDFEDPISAIKKGVKEITEEMRGGWKTISKFDTNGFLIERVTYNGDDKRKEENINYSTIGDSILSITIQFPNDPNTIINKNFLYDKNNFNFYRFEIYSSNRKLNTPIITGDDFIYKDSMLSSYIRFGDTITYIYNDIGQVVKREKAYKSGIQTREYIYDTKNTLTDIITISEPKSATFYFGVITYSEDDNNKFQYRFDDFDEKDNWKTSYYITKEGQIPRSKREIIYY